MSKNSIETRIFGKFVLLLAFLAPLNPGQILAIDADPCADALAVPLNTSLRGFWNRDNEHHLFRVTVPYAGLLTVDVAVPGPDAVEPKLGFLGPDCGGKGAQGDVSVIERSPNNLMLWIRVPGTYTFRAAAQDPRLPIGPLTLRTGFAPNSASLKTDDERDRPLEIEPDPMRVLPPLPGSLEVCRKGELDDHGDIAGCASFLVLDQRISGEIRNPWRDDRDFFVFVLDTQRTVRIETLGGTDTFGSLYDRHAHRLAVDDDGGEGANFRILKTLAAGRYVVRIEGSGGAEGPYALSVESEAW